MLKCQAASRIKFKGGGNKARGNCLLVRVEKPGACILEQATHGQDMGQLYVAEVSVESRFRKSACSSSGDSHH